MANPGQFKFPLEVPLEVTEAILRLLWGQVTPAMEVQSLSLLDRQLLRQQVAQSRWYPVQVLKHPLGRFHFGRPTLELPASAETSHSPRVRPAKATREPLVSVRVKQPAAVAVLCA